MASIFYRVCKRDALMYLKNAVEEYESLRSNDNII